MIKKCPLKFQITGKNEQRYYGIRNLIQCRKHEKTLVTIQCIGNKFLN